MDARPVHPVHTEQHAAGRFAHMRMPLVDGRGWQFVHLSVAQRRSHPTRHEPNPTSEAHSLRHPPPRPAKNTHQSHCLDHIIFDLRRRKGGGNRLASPRSAKGFWVGGGKGGQQGGTSFRKVAVHSM